MSPTHQLEGYEQFDQSPVLAAGLSSREKRSRIAAQRNASSTVGCTENPGGSSSGGTGSGQGLKGQHVPKDVQVEHHHSEDGSKERHDFVRTQANSDTKPVQPGDHTGAMTGASTGSTFMEAQKQGLTSGKHTDPTSDSHGGASWKHDDFPPLTTSQRGQQHQSQPQSKSDSSRDDADLKGVYFKGVDLMRSESKDSPGSNLKHKESPAGTFESHRPVQAPTKFDISATGGSQYGTNDSSSQQRTSAGASGHGVGSNVDSLGSSVPAPGFGGSALSDNKHSIGPKIDPSFEAGEGKQRSQVDSGWKHSAHHGATTGTASASGQSTTSGTSNFNPAGSRIPDFSHRKDVGSTFGGEQSHVSHQSQQSHLGSGKAGTDSHRDSGHSGIQTSETGDELPEPGQQMELEEFMKRGAGPSSVKPERLEGTHPPTRNYGQGSIDGPTTFGLAPGSASGGSLFGAHDSGSKSSGFGSLGSLGKNTGSSSTSGGNMQGAYNPAAEAAKEGPMHTKPLMNVTQTGGAQLPFTPSKSLHEDTARSGASGAKEHRQGSEAKEVKPY
jgi:hypothetical protein